MNKWYKKGSRSPLFPDHENIIHFQFCPSCMTTQRKAAAWLSILISEGESSVGGRETQLNSVRLNFISLSKICTKPAKQRAEMGGGGSIWFAVTAYQWVYSHKKRKQMVCQGRWFTIRIADLTPISNTWSKSDQHYFRELSLRSDSLDPHRKSPSPL